MSENSELLVRLRHYRQCQLRSHCADAVHAWTWNQWFSAAHRLFPERIYAEAGVRDFSAEQRARSEFETFAEAIVEMCRIQQAVCVKVSARNDKLEAELRQLQAGHLLRSHDEILAAIETCQKTMGTVGVSARSQYAASRIAEALKWVLEPPDVPTLTGFDSRRPA